jgi:hypothetical protein
MSLVSRSIPGLFGGVSQQIPAMRHPTQCAAQDNGLATLVDGLYKRPGTLHRATFPLTGANGASVSASNGAATCHTIDRGVSELYELTLVNGNLMLFNVLTGAAETVAFPNGKGYLASADPENDFRCLTVADYTFVVNRSKVPALTSATSPVNLGNVAYVNVKTSVPSVAYTVTVNDAPITITSTATPTNAAIAVALRNAIAAAAPAMDVSILPGTNVIKILHTTTLVVTVSDGWGNTALQAIHAGVDTFADLPPRFEQGFVVTIHGAASSAKDPYYVRFDGQRWIETLAPGLLYAIDAATMPHQLRPDGAGGWVFERAAWADRKIGDDDTNPAPSFIGEPIRNVFFHRNRLGFLAGDSTVLSRAGTYFNFWATTATQVLDTDPIDLSASTEDVPTLEWTTTYNKTLLVWGSTKQQFVLTAGDILSPNTARLEPTTTFETDTGVDPVAIGNRILFASPLGVNTQLNLYRVAEDMVTNRSEDLSEHVPHYIPAAPRQLAVSTVLKALVVVPRGASNELVLFRFATDDKDVMTQRAWQRISLAGPNTVRIMGAHWRSRTLYLFLHVTNAADSVSGGRFVCHTLDFDVQSKDDQAGFALCLDERAKVTAGAFDGTNTVIDLPYLAAGPMVALRCADGVEPTQLGIVSVVHNQLALSTRLTVAGNQAGAVVWAGRPFNFRYEFTEVFFRDAQGLPIMEAAVKLKRILVRYTDTGYFKATVTPLLRATYTYPVSGRDIGMPGEGASQLALSTGEFAIPVDTKAASVIVTLESDSYFPCKFPYAEWSGDVTMKAQR